MANGSSQRLGVNVLDLNGLRRTADLSGVNPHHIIPNQARNHPALKDIGFDMDHGANGLLLPTSFHGWSSDHRSYNFAMERALDDIQRSGLSVAKKRELVQSLQAKAVTGVLDNDNSSNTATNLLTTSK